MQAYVAARALGVQAIRGLITLEEMLAALVPAVEAPPAGGRIVDVPASRVAHSSQTSSSG